MAHHPTFHFALTSGAFCALVFAGCLKASHRLDGEVHVEGPTSAWGVPLARLTLSSADLPTSFVDAVQSNGMGTPFVWHANLEPQVLEAGTWWEWPNLEAGFDQVLSAEDVQAMNAVPAGVPFELTVEASMPLEGLNGTEVSRVVFSGGTLRCASTAPSGLFATTDLLIPNLFHDGQPVVVTIESAGGAVEVDLAGTTLLFPPSEANMNAVAQVALQRSGEAVAGGGTLSWALIWDAPKVDLFEGRLAPQVPVELSGELPLNLPSWLTGTFGLSAPELVLFVENEQGIACSMDVSGQIHSTNTPLPTPFVWTPSSPAVLPAAPAPHHVASAAIALDNASTSPPLGEWMHPGLSGLSYTARFTVLDAGSDLQFMTSEGRITMQPVIKVPFIGYAAQIAFRDTVPCDLQAALAEQLPDPLNWQNAERIALRFQTANLFPFGVAVQAQFLDAAGDPVDSLFMSSTTILEGAATEWQGSYYVPVAPGRSNWDLVFEGPSVEQLMQSGVQSLAFELTGCTSGSMEERPVAFVPGMGLEIQVGLRADLNLSTP